MVRVNWTESSQLDLYEIKDYISKDSRKYAEIELKKIISTAKKLADFPKSGKIVSKNYTPQIRQAISGNYKIIYQYHPDEILILRIIHGAQNTDFDNLVFEPEEEYN